MPGNPRDDHDSRTLLPRPQDRCSKSDLTIAAIRGAIVERMPGRRLGTPKTLTI
jgi:hypothetical protein